MRHLISFIALSTIGLSAAQAEVQTFERDGIQYSYDVSATENGSRIVGRNLSTGEHFVLRVRGNVVTGTYNGNRVSFTTNDAAADKLAMR